MIDNYKQTVLHIEYDPSISAFRRKIFSSSIICDACGTRGRPAVCCYRKGIHFLSRDLQRQTIAYNSKFGDRPETDKSPHPDKSHQILAPAEHKQILTTNQSLPLRINYNRPPSMKILKMRKILLHPPLSASPQKNLLHKIFQPDGTVQNKKFTTLQKNC
jgi:hypothetical protein